MLHLYERIDKLCKDAGTNVTQMCKSAGIPRSSLSDYKSGRKQSISFANLQKIANYFEITVDELVNGERVPLDDQLADIENRKKSPDTQMSEDEELNEYLERLKNNPGMRILFSKTKNATREELEKVIKIFDVVRGEDYGRGYY